jgi:hypothetical protein
LDFTGWLAYFLTRFDQPVAEPLMILFRTKVGQKFPQCVPRRPFSEEDHSLQALLFDRAHESLEDDVLLVVIDPPGQSDQEKVPGL